MKNETGMGCFLLRACRVWSPGGLKSKIGDLAGYFGTTSFLRTETPNGPKMFNAHAAEERQAKLEEIRDRGWGSSRKTRFTVLKK